MSEQRRISEAELHAYVDGELAAEDRAEVEALLAAAPADLAAARELAELNEAIRGRYAGKLDEQVPDAMLRTLSRMPRWPAALTRRRAAAAAALVLVLMSGIAGGYVARGLMAEAIVPEPAFVANAIGAHSVYVPEVRHPVEVKADEEHLIRWLTRRVGAPIRAPSLVDHGWKLMGGRLLPDLGLPAAQFMYEDAQGRRMTLYIRKETDLTNTAFRFSEKDGFGAFYWIDRPLAYALAGRLSRDELMTLANTVYAQLEATSATKAPAEPRQ
jgi:anti-sigma factor RsiW